MINKSEKIASARNTYNSNRKTPRLRDKKAKPNTGNVCCDYQFEVS